MRAVDRLTVDGALAALAQIEGTMAAFVETAPRAVAEMGGVEGLIARSQMSPIGPIPRFTVEEWSAISNECQSLDRSGAYSTLTIFALDADTYPR
jgi:hypothetical protein